MAFWKRLVVNVGTTAGASDPIDLREWEGARVEPLTGITSLTYVEADEKEGTYATANGETASSPVVQSGLTVGQTYQLPSALNASHWIKILANASGQVVLMLKKSS